MAAKLSSRSANSQSCGKSERKSEKGVALIVVMLVLLLLSVLVTSGVYTMVSESKASGSFVTANQAFYFAEAGVQRAIDWFSHRYSPLSPIPGLDDSRYPAQLSGSPVTIIYNVPAAVATYPSATQTADFVNFLAATDNSALPLTNNGGGSLIGKYSITARLLATSTVNDLFRGPTTIERWRIEATGTVNNGSATLATSQVSTIIEAYAVPFVSKALCASSIDFSSTSHTDSFDSDTGSI